MVFVAHWPQSDRNTTVSFITEFSINRKFHLLQLLFKSVTKKQSTVGLGSALPFIHYTFPLTTQQESWSPTLKWPNENRTPEWHQRTGDTAPIPQSSKSQLQQASPPPLSRATARVQTCERSLCFSGPSGVLCLCQWCWGSLENWAEGDWNGYRHYIPHPPSSHPPVYVSTHPPIHQFPGWLTCYPTKHWICILTKKRQDWALMLLVETVPTQGLGVDTSIYCHPSTKSKRTDAWKSPASELSPVFCKASYNRRSYPCKLQVHGKPSSNLGKGNPGRLPRSMIVNLVFKDLSLTRQHSVTPPTFTVSVLRTPRL